MLLHRAEHGLPSAGALPSSSHSKRGLGSNPAARWGLSVWNLHCLLVSAWVRFFVILYFSPENSSVSPSLTLYL